MSKRVVLVLGFILTVLLLTGCDLIPSVGKTTTPTSAESATDKVVLVAPFRAVLDQGEGVPGARLEYIGQDDDGIHVRIDGQDAYKKTGDSFNWFGPALVDADGNSAAGVELDFKLRVVGVVLDVFQAWGEVDIIVSEPIPVAADLPEDAPLQFSAAVVDYTVARGDTIPGTTLAYLGSTDKGAEFGGLEDYAYREVADSLDWSGQVRSNVYMDLSMRIRAIDDQDVSLLGTATVWIFP